MTADAKVARVRALSDAEERALVTQVEATVFPSIVCVSDLHLGVGTEDETGRLCPLENFLSDGPFARFLANQQRTLPGPHLLVLNGDILDFLRVVGAPTEDRHFDAWAARLQMFGVGRTSQDLRRAVEKHEVEYGLQTDDFKSLWKLDVMASGHPVFFTALATWIKDGGTIVYVRGNHDPEHYWPLVRRAFRDIVSGYCDVEPAVFERQIVFVDASFSVANVFFQHGDGHERLTRCEDPPIRPNATQLELPLGSLVNRYIINKLERVSPFLDNITPVFDAVLEAIKQRPTLAFMLMHRSARLLWRALKRRRGNSMLLAASILAVALSYVVPVAVVVLVLIYLASPAARDWVGQSFLSSPWLRTALGAVGLLAPFIIRKVVDLLHGRRHFAEGEDDFAGGALAALRQRFPQPVSWPTVYAVLGHTHVEDVQSLPPLAGSSRTLYLNTGTWVPRWPKERPDLIGRILLTFVRFRYYDGSYAHEILRWDDGAGAVREATILAPR